MVNVANRKIKGRESSKSRSGFKYVKHDPADIKKRAERKGGRFDSPFAKNVDTLRLKEGENVVRILPPTWDEHKHFGYTLYVHRYVGPDESHYLCPRKMLNKKCPLCEASEEARKGGEDEEAKRLAPTEMTAYWVIDRADDSKEPMPLIWMVHWMADRDITGFTTASRSGNVLYVDHPDDGYDLIIRRTGSGLRTRYSYSFDREATPIDEDPDHQEEIIEYIQDNPIDSVLHFYPTEYLDKLVSLTAEETDEDLDEEAADDDAQESEQEEREARADKRRRAQKARDEDEDEDERRPTRARKARDEDEDEDERRPSRQRRKSSARDAEDDEAVEDDDQEQVVEEDEEDENGGEQDEDVVVEDSEDQDEDDDRGRRRPARKEREERISAKSSRNGKRRAQDDDEDDDDEPAPRVSRVKRSVRRR